MPADPKVKAENEARLKRVSKALGVKVKSKDFIVELARRVAAKAAAGDPNGKDTIQVSFTRDELLLVDRALAVLQAASDRDGPFRKPASDLQERIGWVLGRLG